MLVFLDQNGLTKSRSIIASFTLLQIQTHVALIMSQLKWETDGLLLWALMIISTLSQTTIGKDINMPKSIIKLNFENKNLFKDYSKVSK